MGEGSGILGGQDHAGWILLEYKELIAPNPGRTGAAISSNSLRECGPR
jgi:hypothetical protein